METHKVPVARSGKVIGNFTVPEIRLEMSALRIVASDYWYNSESRQWVRFSDKFPQSGSSNSSTKLVAPKEPEEIFNRWLKSSDWKNPPEVNEGDEQPATSAQKRILSNYGLEIPSGLKKLQASAWIDKLPGYPLADSEKTQEYGHEDWQKCPPREKRLSDTRSASEAQLRVIRGYELTPPSDLTLREASRWIDILFSSPGAIKFRWEITHKLNTAEAFLKGVRAHRTRGNSQRLTSEILGEVVRSLYEENKDLFAEREVESEYGGTFTKFAHSSRLAEAFMERMRRDYPGCVDGEAPPPRARPVPTPAIAPIPSTPKSKGCVLLILPPLLACAWLLAT